MGRALAKSVLVFVLLANAWWLAGCRVQPPASPRAGSETSRTPVADDTADEKKAWYERVLVASDVASALASSSQAASIPVGAAAEAAGSLPTWLERRGSSRDLRSGPAESIGGITLLHHVSCRSDGGELEKPVWTAMGGMTLYRVRVVSGERYVGEYVIQYDQEPTPVSHADDEISELVTDTPSGSFSLAQDAARVLLWRHLGRQAFEYVVTYSELSAGTWVVGHRGESTAGVYLGDCSQGEPTGLDRHVQKVVTPGLVFDEKGIEDNYLLVSQSVLVP